MVKEKGVGVSNMKALGDLSKVCFGRSTEFNLDGSELGKGHNNNCLGKKKKDGRVGRRKLSMEGWFYCCYCLK